MKPPSSRYAAVLDSSAVLAAVREEPGHEQVSAVLSQSVISSVNLAEVLAKVLERALPLDAHEAALANSGLAVEPFGPADARASALLYLPTRPRGLSFGDRACLALGQRLGLPVLTADRAWADLNLGIAVTVIR